MQKSSCCQILYEFTIYVFAMFAGHRWLVSNYLFFCWSNHVNSSGFLANLLDRSNSLVASIFDSAYITFADRGLSQIYKVSKRDSGLFFEEYSKTIPPFRFSMLVVEQRLRDR